MRAQKTSVEIFVGSPIEQGSEQQFLKELVSWLNKEDHDAVVLANLHLAGRQIDFVVAFGSSASVVEIKSSYHSVRGGINGEWERLTASGEWRPYTNGYTQALDAKNRLRDAMQRIKAPGTYYPDAHVVFHKTLPAGSELTHGDFKVHVADLSAFFDSVQTEGALDWSLENWREFARKNSLRQVSLEHAVSSPGAVALDAFCAAVAAEFQAEGARWLPENSVLKEQLVGSVTDRPGCFVYGPSGCGKSLAAKWLASEMSRKGWLVFFVAAKDFDTSWMTVLRREIGLMVDGNPEHFLRTAIRSERPILFVLDGINEFSEIGELALRGIRTLARRYDAKIVLTDQGNRPDNFSGLDEVRIDPPSLDLKKRIAGNEGTVLSQMALNVLEAVGSGFEANIIGQIGKNLKGDVPRVLLIDQYIRQRLANHARLGSLGLRKFAKTLHQHIAFSMSEPRFDDLMLSLGLGSVDCDALFSSGLLVKHSGRVSFFHEMLMNACAALEFARAAEEVPASLLGQLERPDLEPLAEDILGAIEDQAICRELLSQTTNVPLLIKARKGELGVVAKAASSDLLDVTRADCLAEIEGLRLELTKNENVVMVGWEEATQRLWTAPERARLAAFGELAIRGVTTNEYLHLCEKMDTRLQDERARWANFAKQEKVPLRSQAFSNAYLGLGAGIGFTIAAKASKYFFQRDEKRLEGLGIPIEDMTSGQLYFYLNMRHHFREKGPDDFARELIFLFSERFPWEPYHVQLDMLHSVGYASKASQSVLQQLVTAINSLDVHPTNLGINSSIVDALKMLGAIDDEGENTRADVKAQIAEAVGATENEEIYDLALRLYASMTDHPFDWIFAEEIHELEENQQHLLFRRAMKSRNTGRSMETDWLAKRISSYQDPTDVALFQPFTKCPDPADPFQQGVWSTFILATRFIAKHSGELEFSEPETVEERCFRDVQLLLFATEAKNNGKNVDTSAPWARLHATEPQLVVGFLSEFQKAIVGYMQLDNDLPTIDFIDDFPEDCLRVSRRFIDVGADPIYWGRLADDLDGAEFAFDCVARLGDRSDIERLRAHSNDSKFARFAIKALKDLDTR